MINPAEALIKPHASTMPMYRLHVWPEKKMCHLIDSIIRNYYVPPVLFAAKSVQGRPSKRVCVDGKQRLTSIQK
ncbi:hypothetical protein BC938DRAFT_480485 [Jimgerdemannia flammicorona]|uniref:GmrSD restriction endonucleases N-terminal domain-containing protein n=1 Tax=Jimgerdemannia flammicorona TaxID=994334 RepID=A0A433QIF3_9FUNG|nr:hypothetical protein BC938DRAFT_480485 [Jimgerdemannia flammicorona]